MRQLRLDDVAPHAHQLRLLVDERAGAPVVVARRGVADLQSRFLQHPVGGVQDALDLFGGQHLERRPGIGEPRDGREGGPDVRAARGCGHGAGRGGRGSIGHGRPVAMRQRRRCDEAPRERAGTRGLQSIRTPGCPTVRRPGGVPRGCSGLTALASALRCQGEGASRVRSGRRAGPRHVPARCVAWRAHAAVRLRCP